MPKNVWKPTQVVLVLQGGGALGAYQVGVVEAMHERGFEPDWVIGTSIGAINGALIAGNVPAHRVERLDEFWHRVSHEPKTDWLDTLVPGYGILNTMLRGVDSFFSPNPLSLLGLRAPIGVDASGFYTVEPLRASLNELVEVDRLNSKKPRFTVGAVNVLTGAMHYFDSRYRALAIDHVMASGALPPAFPAVMIDGEPYWDGGLYSNTPVEVVLDDNPRRDSLIFMVNVWQHRGKQPESLWDVLGREKDIQYSSRAGSHLLRQAQLHRSRNIIRQLEDLLTPEQKADPKIQALTAYGCSTTMHILDLLAPRLPGEDYTKDVDFSRDGIRLRRQAGYADTIRMLDAKPWEVESDPIQGVVVHHATAP